MTRNKRPARVAVIGGGCAGLTAAFELTRPELDGQYEVTVYQMGWRLGGKGASGRGVADRIEEHGLHLWMGFYENAFRLMRDCYDALPPKKGRRFTHWTDAFKPARDVAVVDQNDDGSWDFWRAHFPAGRGVPGDPLDTNSPFTVRWYLRQSAMLIGELLRSAQQIEAERGATDAALRYGQLAAAAAVHEIGDTLRQAVDAFIPQMSRDALEPLLRPIDALATAARRQLEQMIGDDGELRRVWQVIDLILAILRGAALNGMAFDTRGFDAINDHDWRDWLRMNGASEQSLESGFMRGIYDLAFAFEDGDVNRPRLAAGVALRGAMRMFFTYRGSLFWRMSAGMGDVVFAPLYEVLKARGVRFEFFHRLRNVGLAEENYVESLEFDVQAKVKGGGEYQPLVDVHDVPSWPAVPDFSQLVGGAALQREKRSFEGHWEGRRAGTRKLRVTKDFDFVVLGVSVGAIPHVAPELIAREPRWAGMVERVKSVPTQAFQVWMHEDMNALGWPHPPSNLSGFVEPFDTWADMTHLVPEESWTREVKSIAYFCSVLPDTTPKGGVSAEYYAAQREVVRRNAVQFLNRDVSSLWPCAAKKGVFRWDLLAAEGGRATGAERFRTQFWTANVNPSDRYVLSLPGSIEYRLSPLDLHFDNLTIAGDWTATGLDTGCIESAVMSGRLAAHALSHHPPLEDIVGYDHP